MKTLKEAKAIVGGLSNPSKMPGYGYGLSAFKCMTGSKLRLIKNSTCSMCYALKLRYIWRPTKKAMPTGLNQSRIRDGLRPWFCW